MDNMLDKVILKSEYSRQFPDPLNKLINGDPYKIEHHVLLCKAIDVPSGIRKDPNPRKQRIDRGIYNEVRDSLENGGEPFFHLKNKGITLLAHNVEYSDDKRVATIRLGEGEGIVDGGHTYEIILAAQSESTCPDNQYVKFEIITGIPTTMSTDITGGLNTAVQVQQASLDNAKGDFDWIKEAIKGMPYENKIAFMQNENAPFQVRDIIAFLTLFNVENKELKDTQPKLAYTSKSACLTLFENDPESYKKLKPILKDILYLHDYVHIQSREMYNTVKGGRAAGMKGVYNLRERGTFNFVFMGAESNAKLYDGALFPILGALRFLVEIKPGEDHYSWKFDSFEKVKSFFDSVAASMIETTYNTSVIYGRKPNAVGKDDNHWDNLYKTVALAYLQKKS